MKHVRITSTAELRAVLTGLDKERLYRGQVDHFEKNGSPSVVTSFDRKGCVPSKMLKWCQYASAVLEAHVGEHVDSLQFVEALLQHYGWRSWYVDCTTSAAVAAWFASHVYDETGRSELSEDCEERPIWLAKRYARYDFKEGDGNLYIFGKAVVEKLVGVADLAALKIEGARPRTEAQSAWLLGPLQNAEVPKECFIAHITAPRAVFRDYAAEEGLTQTDHVFPSRADDPILQALLGLPWKKIDHPLNRMGIPFFERALSLPEYEDSFEKIAARSSAFYQGALVEDRGSIDGVKCAGISVRVPDQALFGIADKPLRFPKITQLLRKHQSVAFEIDDLIKHPAMRHTVLYQKGLVAVRHEDALVELAALMVEHPGLDLTEAGMNQGWYYRIGGDGVWVREIHPEQCDCGSERVHGRHLSALLIIEDFLSDPNGYGDLTHRSQRAVADTIS